MTRTSGLEGKIALVTGAASGIGAAVAEELSTRGAQVLRADIAPKNGEGWFTLDVASEAEWTQLVAKITELHGGIDILVNAAGVAYENDTVDTCTEAMWQKTLAINLDGTFFGCKHTIPVMRERGGGAIINMGSVLGQVGSGDAVAYVASKGGVCLLTKSVALHCAEKAKNVRCNVVCPGYTETPMLTNWFDAVEDGMRDILESAHPMKRLGKPEEVARLVAYLASDEAAAVTGGEFAVDGGYLAR